MKRNLLPVALFALLFLFLLNGGRFDGQEGPTPATDERFCADPNGDGVINISDAVGILEFLFSGGQAPYCVAGPVSLEDLFVPRSEVEDVIRSVLERIDSLEASEGDPLQTVTLSVERTPGENGTLLLRAMMGIEDASKDRPYLLRLGPGTFDLEDASLVMKEYVDIEGSGEHMTTITGCGSPMANRGTVMGANHAELRFLTIENYGQGLLATGRTCESGTHAIALYNDGTVPRVSHVSLRALQELGGGVLAYGIFNKGPIAGPRMSDSFVVARGGTNTVSYGIYNLDVSSSPPIVSTAISANGGAKAEGMLNNASSARLRGVSIFGRDVAIRNMAGGGGTHRVVLVGSTIETSQAGVGINNDDDFIVELVDSQVAATREVEGRGSVVRRGAIFEDVIADSTRFSVQTTAGARFDVDADGATWIELRDKNVRGPLGQSTRRLIDTSSGGYLSAAGVWTNASDRELKENSTPVNSDEILQKVADLPIATWNYKVDDPAIRHVGPTAQDFRAAFGLGDDGEHVATIDTDGVALAAIQGLHARGLDKDRAIARLETAVKVAQDEARELRERLEKLERRVKK